MPSWARCWRKACWPPSSACCSTAGTAAMSTPGSRPPSASSSPTRCTNARRSCGWPTTGCSAKWTNANAPRRGCTLQDELVQASKLALLGQVAAGVAHEINQPVAAIRSYADNAAEFLRRQDPETARETWNPSPRSRNASAISPASCALAQGQHAGRADQPGRGAGRRAAAGRPRAARAWRCIGRPPARMRVLADRIRLEQVLVNLLQNALDALGGQPAAASPWPCATRASGCSSISMTTDRA